MKPCAILLHDHAANYNLVSALTLIQATPKVEWYRILYQLVLPVYLNGLSRAARSAMDASHMRLIQEATFVSSWIWSFNVF